VTVAETTIEIAAPAETIYGLASATERWPELLPHYRFVHVLDERGPVRVVEMGAWRHVFPIRWVAEQTNDPERPHISFRHLRGWTRGMDVEWLFAPLGPARTRVTIVHRLQFAFPIAAEWLGQHVVAGYFIDGVATRTLARMKMLAERAA
jgi:uncharacterized membrane protein